MRRLPILLLLMLPALAFGQAPDPGDKYIWIRTADGTPIRSGAICYGDPLICDQRMVDVSSAVDFGGAPVAGLSGLTSAAFSTNTIDISRTSRLYIRVEGEAGTNSATIRVWGADGNATVARTVLGESSIDTAYLADATNSASLGTGLSCTTACYVAPLYWVETHGLSAARIQVTAVSGTVSIYAGTGVGQ